MEPTFDVRIWFDIEQDVLRENDAYWEYENGDDYDGTYVGPSAPPDIYAREVTILGVVNLLTSIAPEHRPLIYAMDIQLAGMT